MWSLNTSSGTLFALGPARGQTRYALALGEASHFASPAAADGRVFVPLVRQVVALGG